MAGDMVSGETPENKKGAALIAEWDETPFIKFSALFLGAFITLIALAWAVELPLKLGFEWLEEQAMVACLGLVLGVVFIRYPAGGGRRRHAVPWYDAICALAGLGVATWLVVIYEDIELNPFAMRDQMFWISMVLLPLVWESLRRTAGLSLTVIFSAFVLYAFIGHWVPGEMFKGVEQAPYRLIAELGTNNASILGLPLKIIVLTVVLFIWMGRVDFLQTPR